ncbi:MAG TPA: T9SS type A sorting domain-containing protein [Rhodothermales bacterium]|nr:T9SS type A sorting domain-containing protein [Rhodothermales bacterium]
MFACFGLLLSDVAMASAQPYDLKPENWFPLDLGSYWHYKYEDGFGFSDTVVIHAEKDTLVDGHRWVQQKRVYCAGPTCFGESKIWYRFTEDHYLLQSPTLRYFAAPDTVLATQPQSIFAASTPEDTLQTWRFEESVLVTIEENAQGNRADSTDFLLLARANYLFTGSFIYKIGLANSLVGAVVGGLRYGDTSLITSVALPVEAPVNRSSTPLTVDVFPNPAREMPTIHLHASEQGFYQIAIYNVLGQRVFEEEQRLIPQAWWQPKWQTARSPDGVYFIQIKRDGLLQTSKSFILTR